MGRASIDVIHALDSLGLRITGPAAIATKPARKCSKWWPGTPGSQAPTCWPDSAGRVSGRAAARLRFLSS